MATKEIHIHRPQGNDPQGSQIGDLRIGLVHRIGEDAAKPYLAKGFVIVPAGFNPKKDMLPTPKAIDAAPDGGK